MMKIIYVDVLLGLNFFINYYSLLAVSKISGHEKVRVRFIISSVFASLSSLLIFAPQSSWIFSVFIKTIITVAIILLAFKITYIKSFFVLSATFFGVSFLYAGSMMFIWLLSTSKNIIINNSIVYINISPDIFICCVIAVYSVITIIKKFSSHKDFTNEIFDIELHFKNKIHTFKCFYDSGLFLKDVFTENAILVIDDFVALKLSGYNSDTIKNVDMISDVEVRIIPCSTVSSEGILYGIKIDKAIIVGKNSFYVLNPIVVLSKTKLKSGCHVMIGESFYNLCKENLNVQSNLIKIK